MQRKLCRKTVNYILEFQTFFVTLPLNSSFENQRIFSENNCTVLELYQAPSSMTEIEASQIKVTGPGLTEGTTGKKCMVFFTGAPIAELEKGITHSVDGPQKSELIFDFEKENTEGQIEACYVPLLPGNYKITVRFNGRQIPGSPFKPKVAGPPISAEKLLSKVCI